MASAVVLDRSVGHHVPRRLLAATPPTEGEGHTAVYATDQFSTLASRTEELIDTLKWVTPETSKHGGARALRSSVTRTISTRYSPFTRCTTCKHYEEYLDCREEIGDASMLRAMLTEDMNVSYYDEEFAIKASRLLVVAVANKRIVH